MSAEQEFSPSPDWVDVCALEAVPQVMPLRVEVDGRGLLICRTPEPPGISGVDEVCPHKQRSMAQGVVFDGQIVCPFHQYSFDLTTGRCRNQRCAPVEVFETRVHEGRVWVRVSWRG